MTEPVSREDLTSALDDVRWALEDRIAAQEQLLRNLENVVDTWTAKVEELEAEVVTLRQTLTAVILLAIEHEDAVNVAEQVLRERGR